jgi:hypothetical protein
MTSLKAFVEFDGNNRIVMPDEPNYRKDGGS